MNLPAMIFRYEPRQTGLVGLRRLAESECAATAGARRVRLGERVKRKLRAASRFGDPSRALVAICAVSAR